MEVKKYGFHGGTRLSLFTLGTNVMIGDVTNFVFWQNKKEFSLQKFEYICSIATQGHGFVLNLKMPKPSVKFSLKFK